MDIPPVPNKFGHWDSLTVDATVRASSAAAFWGAMPPACVVLHSWERGAPKDRAATAGQAPPEMREMLDRPRGHVWRTWTADDKESEPWLEIDLGKPVTFDTVCLREKFNRIRAFRLQVDRGNDWQTIFEGQQLDVFRLALLQPVTARKVRLLVTRSERAYGEKFQGPAIQEFDLFLKSP